MGRKVPTLRPAVAAMMLVTAAALAAGPSAALPPKPKKPPPAPQVPKGYAASVKAWHTATPGKTAPLDGSGRPRLALYALNTQDRVELDAETARGGFTTESLERAARFLRDPRTGNSFPVEPKLLDTVYQLQVHFGAAELRVVSGYRTPKPGGHSNHGRGRALDFVMPGVTDEDVAKFAREMGFVGVGTYPTSGFVHVDVRDRSYFWVDTSGPGRSRRERGVLGELAAKSDAAARERGERSIGPFVIGTNVDSALASRGHDGDPTSESDDEDEGM